jgi:hypothetical protein
MSIFSNKGETVRLGKYVAEHYSEPVSYYSRTIFTLAPLFLDLDFKIVPSSNGSLSLPHSFIECIDYYLGNIENLKLTNATPSLYLKDIIGAQTWFPSYGHFHDELYILEDFAKLHFKNAACLLDYHINNDFVKGIPPSSNYIEMERMILKTPSLNMHLRPSVVSRISNLALIRNTLQDEGFHSFPVHISERLVNSARNTIESFYDKPLQPRGPLFISRKGGARSHRLFDNIVELENELKGKDVSVIYPETLSFTEMIFMVSSATSLVMTWGSAITNLAYATPGSAIIILRSNSYKGEQLSMFEKITKNRSLNVTVIDTNDENCIDFHSVIVALNRL